MRTATAAERPMAAEVRASDVVDRHPVSRWLLWRLMARHDRVLVPVWLAVLVLTCYASAAATPALYRSDVSRTAAAAAINASPGIVALYGPILDVTSVGELAMTKMTVLYAVLVSVMVLFVVRRHTRGDEEAGRSELLGAAAVRATTPMRAAVAYGSAVSVLLGIAVALANIAGGLPVAGSVAFGAAWAGTGLVAVGITALSCQLSASPRTCAAIASMAFGVLFVLRAVGDGTSASWLSWLSPYGWNTQLRAYSGTRWAVLVLYVVLGFGLMAAADHVRRSRDLGAGLIEERPGRSDGSQWLRDITALGLRVHRLMLIGWTVVIFAVGVVFGAIIPGFDAFDTGDVKDMLARVGGTGTFRDVMVAAVISMVALVVTCFGIAVISHAGTDEREGRTDQVLAVATSRARAFTTVVAIAIGGSTWLLAVSGVALAVGLRGGGEAGFMRIVASSLAQAPAVWLVTALGVVCFAWSSRWAVLGWAVVVVAATLGQIGALLDLPQLVIDLSPYTHSPKMPHESFQPLPAVVLTAITVALLAVAWARYRTRDIG